MNLLQIAQAVKRESGVGAANSITTVATATGDDLRIFDWVNWVCRAITLSRTDWRWRRGSATLASTSTIANTPAAFGIASFGEWKVPTQEYKPTCYRVSEGPIAERPLQWMDYDVFRQTFLVGVHTPGPAQYWSVSPTNEFLIGPTPDAPHFLRADYIKGYTDLTANDDVPAFPADYHMLAVWDALMEYGEFDAASEVYARAMRNASALRLRLLNDQASKPRFRARSLS